MAFHNIAALFTISACLANWLSSGYAVDIQITPASTSELLSEDVSISCRPGQLEAEVILLMKISRDNEQHESLAAVYQDHPVTYTNQSLHQYLPVGHIDDARIEESFLNLTLVSPDSSQSGDYRCHVTYLDKLGEIRNAAATASLQVTKIDFKSTQSMFERLEKRIQELETTAIQKDQSQKMEMRKLKTAHQSDLTECSKRQAKLESQVKHLISQQDRMLHSGEMSCDDQSWTASRTTCYKALEQTATWSAARDACHALGGNLVQILDKYTNALVGGLLKPGHHYWIGANDLEKKGQFVFDGLKQKISYTNWAKGEPNSYNGGEHCVDILDIGKDPKVEWNDASCSDTNFSVCQKPMSWKSLWKRYAYPEPNTTQS